MEAAEAMELEYIIETWNPTHTSRHVSVEELMDVYEQIGGVSRQTSPGTI